jgi:hypothetical protein
MDLKYEQKLVITLTFALATLTLALVALGCVLN